MADFAAAQARAKGATPSANREEGKTGAVATKAPSTLPSLIVDGVDRMYCQLADIHAIVVV
jgi:hypothetical protein